MRRPRILAILLACAALPAAILAGCGGGDDSGGGEVDVGPAAAVPANAPIYVDATARPTGSAESDAKQALGKVLDTDDPGAEIESLIDEEGRKQTPKERFTYAADIEPWLGEKAAFFATSFAGEGTGAAVIETTNPEQALAFARKSESGATRTSEQGGTTIYTNPADGDTFARAGDFLVFGDTEAVKAAVDAENGSSLGDDGDFKDAIGGLPGERLGTFYTVPRNLLDAIGPDEIDRSSRALFEQSAGEALDEPVSGALTASADSFDLEFVGGDTASETPESTLVGEVPAQSWLAIGAADLGEIVKQSLERSKDQIPNYEEALRQIEQTTGASLDQLTGALGDAALYVEGFTESTLTGALVVEATDPELIGRLLGQVQTLLQLGSGGGVKPLQLSGGGTGFQINDPSAAPAPIEIALQGGKLVVGYGAGSAERTLTPADTLAQKALFSSAEGRVSDLGTDFFLDFPTVFKLAESMGAKSDPDYVEAKPYLRALSYLISGSGSSGDQTEVKAVLGLR